MALKNGVLLIEFVSWHAGCFESVRLIPVAGHRSTGPRSHLEFEQTTNTEVE